MTVIHGRCIRFIFVHTLRSTYFNSSIFLSLIMGETENAQSTVVAPPDGYGVRMRSTRFHRAGGNGTVEVLRAGDAIYPTKLLN